MNVADRIRNSNIQVHNREAPVYDAAHPEIFGRFEQQRIAKDIDLIASLIATRSCVRVLDIGCGTGNLALKFLNRGYHVRAVDISSQMIEVLRSKVDLTSLDRIEFIVSDAADIMTDTRTYGTWDVIAFSSVLHHLPDYQTVLSFCLRQLRPGGILYVCHEPLAGSTEGKRFGLSLVIKMLDSADNIYIYARKLFVYLVQSLRNRKLFRRIDYSWSDYHAKIGINADEVIRQLESEGAKTLLYETYRSHFASVLTWLDRFLGFPQHSQFRFIMQRHFDDASRSIG